MLRPTEYEQVPAQEAMILGFATNADCSWLHDAYVDLLKLPCLELVLRTQSAYGGVSEIGRRAVA